MPMTVSKTREMLVDVARQLFARMGVDNTTMNDIAQASKKEVDHIPVCQTGCN